MTAAPKKWYNSVWFAVGMFMLGYIIAWVVCRCFYLGAESNINI